MVERQKLQSAIAQAILPYARESKFEDYTDENDPFKDPFIVETAAFLTQEVVDSGLDIKDNFVELDDEDLENLPLTHVLLPPLQDLIPTKDPIAIVSNIIQNYTLAEPDLEAHHHVRLGECEVY